MPGSNNFYPFGQVSTNIESNAEYQADSERTAGAAQQSIARSKLYNKVNRQATAAAYAVGALVAAAGQNASDDSPDTLATNLKAAVNWQARSFAASAATVSGTTVTATVAEMAAMPQADIPPLFSVLLSLSDPLPAGAVLAITSSIPGVVLQWPIYTDPQTPLADDVIIGGAVSLLVDTGANKAFFKPGGGGGMNDTLPELLPNFAADWDDDETIILMADMVPAADNPALDGARWVYSPTGASYPDSPVDGTALTLSKSEITY